MKKVNTTEMRAVEGGASKYVKCPICGYKRKTGWIERIFDTDKKIQGYMSARHFSIGKGYNKSKSVHY